MRRLAVVAVAICLASGPATGCGSDRSTEPDPNPDPFPAGSTPEGAVKRFVAVYNAMDSTEFTRLLTGDFVFEFSPFTDPDLVARFSSGWFKSDEIVSSGRLFLGGTNDSGVFQSAASSIALSLGKMTPSADSTQQGDAAAYKMLLTSVELTIEVPPLPGETEGSTFVVGGRFSPSTHFFHLVRGDAAVDLDGDQPADSSHWYLRLWQDVSSTPGLAAASRAAGTLDPDQSSVSTWGVVKALYR